MSQVVVEIVAVHAKVETVRTEQGRYIYEATMPSFSLSYISHIVSSPVSEQAILVKDDEMFFIFATFTYLR